MNLTHSRSVCSVVALVCALALVWAPGVAWSQGKPAAAAPAAGGKELIAVLDLEGVGASKVEASAVTDRLREELLRTGKFTMVDRSQMDSVLNEQALQQTGCTSQECAVQVGQVLGVRKIVSGRVTKIGDEQWLVSLQVIDVETAETLRAESLRHRGDLFSMLDTAIVALARKLAGNGEAVAAAPAVPKAETPAPAPAAKPEPPTEKKGGMPWWGWALIILGVVGLAAAAGSKKDGGSGTTCTSPSGCGSVTVTW